MKLSQLDVNGALAQSLQWLETCLSAPSVTWAPGQREAATETLLAARNTLQRDVLALASRVYPTQMPVQAPPGAVRRDWGRPGYDRA